MVAEASVSFQNADIMAAEEGSSTTTVTIMMYYTPEFEQKYSDPQATVNSHVAALNDAFVKSDINVRMKVHCTEKIDVMDSRTDDATARLNAFNAAKGDSDYLLNSADMAVLLTAEGVSFKKVMTEM